MDQKSKDKGRQIELLKKLLARLKCPICHTPYGKGDIAILAHHREVWLISSRCPKCGSEGIVFAILTEESVEPVKASELTQAEIRKFSRMPPISADEVLETYNFLRDFDGDVSELLGDESGEDTPAGD